MTKLDEKTLADLESANVKLKAENADLQKMLDESLDRLSEKEMINGKKSATTVIKTKKGKLIFTGNGINVGGKVYTGADLQEDPELAISLFEKGCESLTK